MPRTRKGWLKITSVVAALGLLLGIGGYVGYQRLRVKLLGTNCEVRGPTGDMRLDLEQARNAATIAAVAFRMRLPRQAATIALATALQESKLRNLPYGDRDSVGIFQQRPSQGWGTSDQLQDPVYATVRFYSSLKKVRDYLDLPVPEAAQQVQHSADGSAYAQHEAEATLLSGAFTGHDEHTVRCWWPPDKQRGPQLAEARRQLRYAFGDVRLADGQVLTSTRHFGWAVASWAVAHAWKYGITTVAYAGYRWRASDGYGGWKRDPAVPATAVEIR